jgi:hypothetical protein
MPKTRILLKIKDLPQTLRASGAPEALAISCKLLILNGGQRRDRTAAAGLLGLGGAVAAELPGVS